MIPRICLKYINTGEIRVKHNSVMTGVIFLFRIIFIIIIIRIGIDDSQLEFYPAKLSPVPSTVPVAPVAMDMSPVVTEKNSLDEEPTG